MLEHKELPTMIKNESNINDYNNSNVLPYDLFRTEFFFCNRLFNLVIFQKVRKKTRNKEQLRKTTENTHHGLLVTVPTPY